MAALLIGRVRAESGAGGELVTDIEIDQVSVPTMSD